MLLEPSHDLDRRANLNWLAWRGGSGALDAPQHLECHAIARPFATVSRAIAAAFAYQFDERIADALSRDFDQPELRHWRDLRWGVVLRETLRQRVQHSLDVRRIGKVYEIDDDQTTDAAKPDLPSDLLGGLQVDAEARLLEPGRRREATRIDGDGCECAGGGPDRRG